jgi:hypothetical protein
MNKIDWSKWSAISEIVSSAAILRTLVYLALQTQQLAIQNQQLVTQTEQNTAAIEASSRQAYLNSDLQVLDGILAYPSVFSALYKEKLTEEEAQRLEIWLIELVRTRELQWIQYEKGLLDGRTWEAYRNGLVSNLSFPRTREWWSRHGYEYFDDDFVSAVNEELRDVPIVEDYKPVFLEIQDDDLNP